MKMVQPHRTPAVATLILLLFLQPALEAKESKKVICPIGFQVTYSNTNGEPICYRLKGPEKLTDKYVGCTGNLYTSRLYNSLNLTKSDLVLWTEYKSLYPGGPFIDYSFTKSTGSLLKTTFEVDNPLKGIDEELCVVMDPVKNFTAMSCDDEFYRYCLVPPYKDAMSTEGCDDFKGSLRFWSPKATCLMPLPATAFVGKSAVRATWNKSKELCEKRGSTVLYNGWRYSNNPLLNLSGSLPVFPLGITYDPQRHSHIVNEDATLLDCGGWFPLVSPSIKRSPFELETKGCCRYDTPELSRSRLPSRSVSQPVIRDVWVLTPPAEWGLGDNIESMSGNETSYGAIRNGIWELVNKSYVFFDVVCEKNVEIRKVELVVTADDQNKLILSIGGNVDKDDIYCFTDSVTFFPTPVEISSDIIHNKILTYVLTPKGDGYYWCVHTDSKRFLVSESNRTLWVREEQSLRYNYAVKISIKKEYTLKNAEKLKEIYWEKYLKEYIFYSTKYYEVNRGLEHTQDPESFEDILKVFKSSLPDLNPKEKEILYGLKLKKVFLDKKTVLLHLNLNPKMKPVLPGNWSDIEILYMKPVYYCTADNERFVKSMEVKCQIHSCVGNFNDGVQPVTTMDKNCHQATVTAQYYTNQTTLPTLRGPSTSRPSEQLEEVMQNLQSLIDNEQVSVENISSAFDQIDGLLEEKLDLSIPGQLLHLLDGIGSTLDLGGSENATTVRDNIALLVTDADPNLPVNGLRIASRDQETFTDDAFEILRGDFDSTNLQLENSEAVVKLPDSVATSARRISFVVFRNDRAFHTQSSDDYFVNSRVLSVNIENITEFERGETVDIHFSSLGDPQRNQSRACAFWQFLEGGQGTWSRAGCTFIRATRPGLLDTCRCDHLTHFAEILVPRAVFSEKDEQVLEILSVVGCCVSMFGLIFIGITAALFRSWRRDFSNKIWLQLCISILLLIICFLAIVFVRFDHYGIPCMLVGVLLHYSVLASFCWMLIAAVISYRRLVLVFTRDASHKLLRASAFSWGVPCAIVGILLSVDPQSYAGRFEDKTPTGAFCYPSGLGLWLAVYAPIAVMLLANWTLFVLIVRSVFCAKSGMRDHRHGDRNEAIRCASVSCLLVFLFGLPWIFGLFAHNIVLAYLFALTSTFQGFVLFIFFVVGNKKTRDLWLNKLKIKQTRKIPVTSSTYSNNRSTAAPGLRGTPQNSVEAKVSKPRSLVTSDDSRFS